MIGDTYWTTGIKLKYDGRPDNGGKWSANLDFYDDGFCDDESTEGTLHTRYYVEIETAIDTLIADAKRLGIEIKKGIGDKPFLMLYQDGERYVPDSWRKVLQEQAERIGFQVG